MSWTYVDMKNLLFYLLITAFISSCNTHFVGLMDVGGTATTDSLKKSYNSRCSICLKDLSNKDDIHLTSCKHAFHKDCLSHCTIINPKCPLCRKEIKGDAYKKLIKLRPISYLKCCAWLLLAASEISAVAFTIMCYLTYHGNFGAFCSTPGHIALFAIALPTFIAAVVIAAMLIIIFTGSTPTYYGDGKGSLYVFLSIICLGVLGIMGFFTFRSFMHAFLGRQLLPD